MFKKLNSRLKGWFKKTKEEAEGPKKVEKKKISKEKKADKKKQKKTEKKKSFLKSKFKINESYFDKIWEDLELLLLENNVALEVVEKINENLKEELIEKEIDKKEIENEIKSALKKALEEIFPDSFDLIKKIKNSEKPFKIVFFGINGSGKTTSIAKVANALKKEGFSVVLSASDTFRAASIEQLEKHASNLGIHVIKGQYGSDPASVAFDAVKHVESKKKDVVLIDTAGRMHTESTLMEEMKKITRVVDPDLKIFVAEATTGNDAIEQAKTFNENIGIDGTILTKSDIDEKGGASISISYVSKKPIIYLGVGQEYKDLVKFNKKKMIKQLGL